MTNRVWGPLVFVVAWQALAMLGIVSPLILPSPLETFAALVTHIRELWADSLASLSRLLVGFACGSPAGILVGTWFGVSPRWYGWFELVIDFFRSLPVITVFPLAMIIFGIGDLPKIALVAWTVFLLTVVNTIYGIRQVPRTRVLAARTLGAKGLRLLVKVMIPSAAPTIVAGLRLSLSLGLVAGLVSEMFTGTATGLGKRIYDAGLLYEVPKMYAAILLAGVLGFLVNKVVVMFEQKVVHWSGL